MSSLYVILSYLLGKMKIPIHIRERTRLHDMSDFIAESYSKQAFVHSLIL